MYHFFPLLDECSKFISIVGDFNVESVRLIVMTNLTIPENLKHLPYRPSHEIFLPSWVCKIGLKKAIKKQFTTNFEGAVKIFFLMNG